MGQTERERLMPTMVANASQAGEVVRRRFDSSFAMSLRRGEVDDPQLERHYYWTGWRRRHWPAEIVRPGLVFYGFDPRNRALKVLFKVTRGGSFTYRTKRDFADEVERLTHWRPDAHDRHWKTIPGELRGHVNIGLAIRWRVLKRVQIPLEGRFPQLGWLRVHAPQANTVAADSTKGQEPTFADLLKVTTSREGQRFVAKSRAGKAMNHHSKEPAEKRCRSGRSGTTRRTAVATNSITLAGTRYVSVPEAARILGITLSRVHLLVRQNEFKFVKPEGLRRRYIPASKVSAYRDRRDAWLTRHGRRRPTLAREADSDS